MGLFSKVKNFVTGGGAEVSVETTTPKLEESFTVRVTATPTDDDLEIERAYLMIRGYETVEATVTDHDADNTFDRDHIHLNETTFQQETDLTGATTLKKGEEYTWEKEVQFPSTAQPPYHGENASHELQICAGLDVTGNDPDSGWITLQPE